MGIEQYREQRRRAMYGAPRRTASAQRATAAIGSGQVYSTKAKRGVSRTRKTSSRSRRTRATNKTAARVNANATGASKALLDQMEQLKMLVFYMYIMWMRGGR